MPALFAYLLVVGLLLGGGYGALSWLAEPEPVVVAVKARPKHPSPVHYTANYKAASEPAPTPPPASEAGRAELSPQGISDSERATSSSDQPMSPGSEPAAAASGPASQANTSAPVQQDQPTLSARAEPSSVEIKPEIKEAREEDKQPDQATLPASQATVSAKSNTIIAPARTASHIRSRHSSGKRTLTRMTLRTIEYADGRRVSQLIPYRGGTRAPEFGPDE